MSKSKNKSKKVNSGKKKNGGGRRSINRPSTKKSGGKGPSPSQKYQMMLLDPCRGDLYNGIFGSEYGLMNRCKTSMSVDSGFSAMTFGWIIWFPDFHCAGGGNTASGRSFNVLHFGAAGTSTPAALTNMGNENAASTTTAHSTNDPAHAWIASDSCMDARTCGACLEAFYEGKTSDQKGTVFKLSNIPLELLLRGGSGSAGPTVSDLRAYAQPSIRESASKVRFRPSSDSNKFRIGAATGWSEFAPYFTADAAQVDFSGQATSGCTGIGLLFHNVSALSDYRIELTKIIEWRPEPVSGMTAVQPRGMDNPSIMSTALHALDRMNPNWQTDVKDTAMDLVSIGLQKLVMGGVRGATRAAPLLLT